MSWPAHFDFESDPVCREQFRPFIESEIAALKDYDARRGADITYIFHEHAERVAKNVEKTCLHLGLGPVVARNMYWALLPHDIGKRLLPPPIWDQEEKPDAQMKRLRRTHTELGGQIVARKFPDASHPFKDLMVDIMLNHHEQMDGKGYLGVKGKDLSAPVRLAAIVEAFDGWSIRRPHFGARDVTVPAVLKKMREEKGKAFFDMELFSAFEDMKLAEYGAQK